MHLALAKAWVDVAAPVVEPRACILAARLASEVFSYFAVEHEVLPIWTLVANDAALGLIVDKVPSSSWPREAWTVSAGAHADLGDGWAGHLAVVTDSHFVDLSAAQFDRPQRSILVGGPLVVPIDAMAFDEMWRFPVRCGWYHWGAEENDSYRSSGDWLSNWKRLAGPMIRSVKTHLA